jgi:hypothetical protein
MNIHRLKCWPDMFSMLRHGAKTFELRKDDRHYQADDILFLAEWDPKLGARTGRFLRYRITYVLHPADIQWTEDRPLADGYVVMSLLLTHVYVRMPASPTKEPTT